MRACHKWHYPHCVDPERSYDFPKEYLEKVRKVHQDGEGCGSEGYDNNNYYSNHAIGQ